MALRGIEKGEEYNDGFLAVIDGRYQWLGQHLDIAVLSREHPVHTYHPHGTPKNTVRATWSNAERLIRYEILAPEPQLGVQKLPVTTFHRTEDSLYRFEITDGPPYRESKSTFWTRNALRWGTGIVHAEHLDDLLEPIEYWLRLSEGKVQYNQGSHTEFIETTMRTGATKVFDDLCNYMRQQTKAA